MVNAGRLCGGVCVANQLPGSFFERLQQTPQPTLCVAHTVGSLANFASHIFFLHSHTDISQQGDI
jgi:hypothetical protein